MDRRSSRTDPFRQPWLDPVDDLRERFGRLSPSFSLREVAAWTGLWLLVSVAVVGFLELFV